MTLWPDPSRSAREARRLATPHPAVIGDREPMLPNDDEHHFGILKLPSHDDSEVSPGGMSSISLKRSNPSRST
jgi:hypothetical protein